MALTDKLTSIANAIRQKTGRSALLSLDEMPPEILSIDGGGDVPNPDDPLLLVDWDGTLLYSYTYEEAQLISEFPDPPTHDGLTFQSWNWSEVVAKTWLQNHRGAQLKVGATYTPTDGQDHNYWRSPRLTEPSQIYMQHRATTSVGADAFYNCCSLTSIGLPNGLTSIGDQAFYNCCSLTSIGLPNGLTSIGYQAFYNCCSLTSISLPNGLTSIGGYAFNGCDSLTSISLPNSLTSMGDSAFSSCDSLTSINLSNGLTSIGAYAFYDCNSLTSISLPNDLTSIGAYAFYDCNSLTSISLPNDLTSMGNSAFANCYSLTSISLPNSLTSIGGGAFDSCVSLVDVVLHGTPALGGSGVFGNNPSNQRFYVHRSDLAWFETATNWSAIYGEGKIVAAADYIEYLQSIGVDTSDFEGE